MEDSNTNAGIDNSSGIPEVSILMAVYNGVPTLPTAIRSVLNQTFKNWELILVDDASTDNFQTIVDQFRDPRIKIFRNSTNRGLAASLNRGVAAASAPYIARMDADDICYPTRLEQQLRHLKAQPTIDVLGTEILVFQDDGTPLGIAPAPIEHAAICVSKLAGSFSMYHPTWMGRADWFRRHPYDPAFNKAQDFELLLRAAPTSNYANLPEVLLGYRTDLGICLGNRLQTRVHVLKALTKNMGTVRENIELLLVAGVTVVKLGVDIASSFRVSVVPHKLRFRHPSSNEIDIWRQTWLSSSARHSLLAAGP